MKCFQCCKRSSLKLDGRLTEVRWIEKNRTVGATVYARRWENQLRTEAPPAWPHIMQQNIITKDEPNDPGCTINEIAPRYKVSSRSWWISSMQKLIPTRCQSWCGPCNLLAWESRSRFVLWSLQSPLPTSDIRGVFFLLLFLWLLLFHTASLYGGSG